jgi:hypothetical protein
VYSAGEFAFSIALRRACAREDYKTARALCPHQSVHVRLQRGGPFAALLAFSHPHLVAECCYMHNIRHDLPSSTPLLLHVILTILTPSGLHCRCMQATDFNTLEVFRMIRRLYVPSGMRLSVADNVALTAGIAKSFQNVVHEDKSVQDIMERTHKYNLMLSTVRRVVRKQHTVWRGAWSLVCCLWWVSAP